MKIETDTDVYYGMIKKYGTKTQMLIAVEECSELQKALLKFIRGRHNEMNVCEEIADVEIMLEQLKIMFDKSEIDKFKKLKLDRTYNLYLKEDA